MWFGAVDVNWHRPATRAVNDNVGLALVGLGLGSLHGLLEVVVGKGWVQDL